MSLCKMLLIGNLGRDPEMRYTPSGRPVTQFTMAVNRSSKNQAGEWVEETEWFRVTTWGQLAERTAENLRKGNKVYVEGRFQSREWEGQDGQKRTALEVTADAVLSLERRPREGEPGFDPSFTPRQATTSPTRGGGEARGGEARGGDSRAESRGESRGGEFDDRGDIDDLPF
jgi:single-strand DNA-binding protein